MTECNACGARVSSSEHFCGNCGTQLIPSSAELRTVSANIGDDGEVRPEWAETLEPEETPIAAEQPISEILETTVVAPEESPAPISSNSLGGSFTDNVQAPGATSSPKREGTTGGHRPSAKQLAANTVLNGRYEIVRRIGGGGMGAVYLAKDRNLGDAPRAVKEMVESHIDSSQHEKAIGDFKRE